MSCRHRRRERFGIMNTLITVTVQKTREIGIMKAIGANIWQIVWVLLAQRMVVGLFGTKWCRTTSEHLHRRVHYLLVRRADPRVLRGATRSGESAAF
jgi:cell division protein FtsX